MFAAKSAQVWASVHWPPTKHLRTAVLETVLQQVAAEGALHGSGRAAAAPLKYPTISDCCGRRASHVMETRDRSSHLAFSPLADHRDAGKNGGGQVSMQGRWKQQGLLSIQSSEDAPSRHCNRQHGLAVHTATSPHHQFPTVGFALCLDKKQLHHKPWRGQKEEARR